MMELLDASDQPGLGEGDLAAVGTDTQTDKHLMELLDVSDQPGLGEEDLATVGTDTQTDTHLMDLLDVSDQPSGNRYTNNRPTDSDLMELLDVRDQSGLGEEDHAAVGTDTQTTDLQTLT